MFEVVLDGTRYKSEIVIDLVANPAEIGKVNLITPANKPDVKDLTVFDYLVYPVERAMTDKICATMQAYPSGHESSRVKNFVDLMLLVTRYGMANPTSRGPSRRKRE